MKRATLIIVTALALQVYADACSSDDLGRLQDPDALQSGLQGCSGSCLISFNRKKCVSQCMNKKFGVSEGCGNCFGDNVQCTLGSCLGRCLNPGSESCLLCSLDKCGTGLQQCSGVSGCGNSKDRGLLQGADLAQVWTDCAKNCQGKSSDSEAHDCTAQCIHSNRQTSMACGGCFGERSKCAFFGSCSGQCGNGQAESADCQSCLSSNCDARFNQCTGLSQNTLA